MKVPGAFIVHIKFLSRGSDDQLPSPRPSANHSKETEGLSFHLQDQGHVATIAWENVPVSHLTPEEILHAPKRKREPTELHHAMDWLQDYLADGPKPAKEVYEAAEAEMISKGTLKRARGELGKKLKLERDGYQGTYHWLLIDGS